MSATETIEVRLTMPEWQIIYAGLGELPLKVSANVAQKLQQQIAGAAQQQAQRANGELHEEQEATP